MCSPWCMEHRVQLVARLAADDRCCSGQQRRVATAHRAYGMRVLSREHRVRLDAHWLAADYGRCSRAAAARGYGSSRLKCVCRAVASASDKGIFRAACYPNKGSPTRVTGQPWNQIGTSDHMRIGAQPDGSCIVIGDVEARPCYQACSGAVRERLLDGCCCSAAEAVRRRIATHSKNRRASSWGDAAAMLMLGCSMDAAALRRQRCDGGSPCIQTRTRQLMGRRGSYAYAWLLDGCCCSAASAVRWRIATHSEINAPAHGAARQLRLCLASR